MSGRAEERPGAAESEPPGLAPGRRSAQAFGRLLVLCATASLAWSVQDFWEPRADATRYLLAARSLAAGDGYTIFGAPFRLRPPGFSALISPVVARYGYDFAALNLFVSVFGILAVLLLYLLLLPRVGAPLAFFTALFVWLTPHFQRLCNLVMSDVPGLAAGLLSLLVLRWANRKPGLARDVLLGVSVAVAIYLRSVYLLLLPAVVLDRVSRRFLAARADAALGPAAFVVRRIVPPIAVTVLLYLPWAMQPQAPRGSYGEAWVESYWTALLHRDAREADSPFLGLSGWHVRIEGNGRTYAAAFASGLNHAIPGPYTWPVATLGIIGLSSVLIRRREAPEWFAFAMLALLLIYFESATRLFLPVFVLMVGATVESLRRLAMRLASARVADGALAVLIVVITFGNFRSDFMARQARANYLDLLAVTRRLNQSVSADAPLGGDIGPVYALLLDRPVHSLRPLLRRRSKRTLERAIDEQGMVAVVARDKGKFGSLLRARAEEGGRIETVGRYVILYVDRVGRS